MSGKCGCRIRWEHNALSGSEGDAEIVYCPLHENAGELVKAVKEFFKGGWEGMPKATFEQYADIISLIAKASQPGKESK